VKYISTRGACPEQNFEQVLLAGMAPDGGLYVPAEIPQFSIEEIRSWKTLSYPELALKIIAPFMGDEIEAGALSKIIEESYAEFDHPDIAPLTALNQNEWLLELYHGPTLAFKDFALQVLGRLLDYVLVKNDQRAVILGATSGDTGSAALEGCRHSDRVDIFILHPHQRVSDVQRKQMTTVAGDNVFNLAVEGNFDDCQRIVKAAFADQSFLPSDCQLVAVNSINWARIMMQIVYYF
jgi:threonine synthase